MSRGALNVLLVHGIGDHPKEFVGEFERQLRADLQKHLNALARRYKLSAPPPADALNLIPGRWAPVTEGIQKEVEQRIFHGPVDFLRWFGMRFMGDVVAYQGRAVYDEIHRALAANLLDQVQPESGHLTIIAHSLGAVIASDFVYDHTDKIGGTLADRFGVAFSNFNVATLMTNLGKVSEIISNVDLVVSEKSTVEQVPVERFTITMDIKDKG